MVKNILALIGLAVVVKKGHDFYTHYQSLKQENEFLRRANQPGHAGDAAATAQTS